MAAFDCRDITTGSSKGRHGHSSSGLRSMTRIAVAGLGKMGISHIAIARSHPGATLAAVCDSSSYLTKSVNKYIGIKTYTDFARMIASESLDAVIIATPSRHHGHMVRAALEAGLHVFCEKPFCLDYNQGQELADLAERRNLVNQIGYHCRFVGSFREARRLVRSGAIGRIHHLRAEVFGPVVVRSRNSTWRGQKSEGGGCLYDYACHAIDLVNFVVGCPERVEGAVLGKVFSQDVEDAVYCTLYLPGEITGQLACNWSDSSYRKMQTKLVIWGTNGHVSVDRQEVQLYQRDGRLQQTVENPVAEGASWTTTNTAELTECPDYFLRGEEYSAQIEHFLDCIRLGSTQTESSFASAAATDQVLAMIRENAEASPSAKPASAAERIVISNNRIGLFSRARAKISGVA
jgi:scyllo-inositol 2-dehydrogenase (NADP+)